VVLPLPSLVEVEQEVCQPECSSKRCWLNRCGGVQLLIWQGVVYLSGGTLGSNEQRWVEVGDTDG